VRRKIAFWVSKGVLKEKKQPRAAGGPRGEAEIVYSSVDRLESKQDGGESEQESELLEDAEGIISIRESQLEDNRKMLLSFIICILNNTGGCSLEKIYSMLTVYMGGRKDLASVELTKEILQQLVLAQKIKFNGQIYMINS